MLNLITLFSHRKWLRLTQLIKLVVMVAAVLCMWQLGYSPALADDPPLVYVVNANGHSVSIINSVNHTLVATASFGTRGSFLTGYDVAISPKSPWGFVTNFNYNSVSVFDTGSLIAVSYVTVGISPTRLLLDPTGNRLYVANFGSNNVSMINLSPGFTATIPVGQAPFGLVMNGDGTRLYVSNSGSHNVSEIDTSSNKVVTTLPVGQIPGDMAWANELLYVVNRGSNNVSVIDLSSQTTVATITVGSGPRDLVLSPDGRRMYVANSDENTITVIDMVNNYTPVATVTVGAFPRSVAITPDGQWVYVANVMSHTVSVIDTTNNTVATTVNVGKNPIAVRVATPVRKAPFDPKVDGFGFANYQASTVAPYTTTMNALGLRTIFGNQVCASKVNNSDGSCTLTPAAEKWQAWANGLLKDGYCEGMATLSSLYYAGLFSPQTYNVTRTVDISLENNTRLQDSMAGWQTKALVKNPLLPVIKSSPQDVLLALQNNFTARGQAFGVLRFRKLEGGGGHVVLPIGMSQTGETAIITVYDPNYPRETRQLLIDSAANTWFYSPDDTTTEDDYQGDATSQTLGFAPLEPRLGQLPCNFCMSENPIQPTSLVDSTHQKGSQADCPYAGGPGGGCGRIKDEDLAKMEAEFPMPSSYRVAGQLKSWENPARPFYTFVSTDTVRFDLTPPVTLTEAMTDEFTYWGPGYVFEVGNLSPDIAGDFVEIGTGGQTITYTTRSGEVPELFVGFETEAADFGFSIYDFEMEAGDAVVLTIDAVKKLMEVRIVTASPTGDIVFSFGMERLGEESIDIFQSPDEGLTLANDQTLLIDYSKWDGNDKPLDLGYDDNNNGLLDSNELFEVVDAGDSLDGETPAEVTKHIWLPTIVRQ